MMRFPGMKGAMLRVRRVRVVRLGGVLGFGAVVGVEVEVGNRKANKMVV